VNVIALPATIHCGKCGHAMRHESRYFEIGKPVHMVCVTPDCEWHDVPVVFPVTSIEVEKV
jgi:hypothetical protein